jgi:hypothetical protein
MERPVCVQLRERSGRLKGIGVCFGEAATRKEMQGLEQKRED